MKRTVLGFVAYRHRKTECREGFRFCGFSALREASAGRRFLPIRVYSVNILAIADERDKPWAEAVHLFNDGFKWWYLPPDAAEQQEERFAEDSWQGIIQRWLAGRSNDVSYPSRIAPAGNGVPLTWTTTAEILGWALSIDVGKHGKPQQMRVAAIMHRLKWFPDRVMVNGYRERRWVPVKARREAADVPF